MCQIYLNPQDFLIFGNEHATHSFRSVDLFTYLLICVFFVIFFWLFVMQLVNQWSMDRLRDQLTQHQNRLTTTVIQSGYNRNQHHHIGINCQ